LDTFLLVGNVRPVLFRVRLSHMLGAVGAVTKGPFTEFASVRLLSCVYVHMVPVLLFSYEALLADKALEWHGGKVSMFQEHMLL